MDSLVALTILAGRIELRKNPSISGYENRHVGNWYVIIQTPTFFGAESLPKAYCISSNNIAYNQEHEENKVFAYIKRIIDDHWPEPDEYSFDENSTEEFNKLVDKLKPKALAQFMGIINITQHFEVEQVISTVRECFVKNAIES